MKIAFIINPLYWPLWLVCGVLRLLGLLPYSWQVVLGRGLGRVLYLFPSKSKNTAKTNLALCYPELTSLERKSLLKKNYQSLGVFVFEVVLAFWGSDKKLNKIPFKITGMEHYHQAIEKGRGVLFAGPHFTSLEIIGRIVGLHYPLAVIYRKSKIAFLEQLLRPSLERHYEAVVERNNVRGLLRVLQKNLVVCYAADIDGGKKQCVFAPFFGIPAATLTATSRIAQKTGAVVLGVAFYRLDKGQGYEFSCHPLPADYAQGDLEKDARSLNALMEKFIRHKPEQYLWQYKRFKTRPNNEPRFYG